MELVEQYSYPEIQYIWKQIHETFKNMRKRVSSQHSTHRQRQTTTYKRLKNQEWRNEWTGEGRIFHLHSISINQINLEDQFVQVQTAQHHGKPEQFCHHLQRHFTQRFFTLYTTLTTLAMKNTGIKLISYSFTYIINLVSVHVNDYTIATCKHVMFDPTNVGYCH